MMHGSMNIKFLKMNCSVVIKFLELFAICLYTINLLTYAKEVLHTAWNKH